MWIGKRRPDFEARMPLKRVGLMFRYLPAARAAFAGKSASAGQRLRHRHRKALPPSAATDGFRAGRGCRRCVAKATHSYG
jgi:hypothetical protein